MKISVQFESVSLFPDACADEFIRSLYVQSRRCVGFTDEVMAEAESRKIKSAKSLQAQIFDIESEAGFKFYNLRVPISDELLSVSTWHCRIEESEGSKRFCINNRVIAADVRISANLEAAITALPLDLVALSLANLPIVELVPLTQLAGLRSLSLRNCKSAREISNLAALTGLTDLNLCNCESLTDLIPLAGLAGLNNLHLSHCELLKDLCPLANLARLKSLDLSYWKSLSDLSLLSSLTRLPHLDLSGCESITDLRPLARLTGLTQLKLRGCRSIADLRPLARLTGLTQLDLMDCRSVVDLRPLAGLTGLIRLDLNNCRSVNDLSFIKNLTKLETLDLSSVKAMKQLDLVVGMERLTNLILFNCENVVDIAPLAQLKSLRKLDIYGLNRITSIERLRDLVELRKLESSIHPGVAAEVLAHSAGLRADNLMISESADAWFKELEMYRQESGADKERLAVTLGDAFSHLPEEHEIIPLYEALLGRTPDFTAVALRASREGFGRDKVR